MPADNTQQFNKIYNSHEWEKTQFRPTDLVTLQLQYIMNWRECLFNMKSEAGKKIRHDPVANRSNKPNHIWRMEFKSNFHCEG